MPQLPRYKSHKEVQALEIECFNDDRSQMYPLDKGQGPVQIEPEMFARYQPVRGDFYVVYADGYKSFSPRKAFLEGYTRVDAEPVDPDDTQAQLGHPAR